MSIQSQVVASRYELVEPVGVGGMGTVFKAQDTHTNTWVAVKRLKADLLGEHSTDIIERFNREGEALRRLNHPNIVKVLESVVDNGQHYIVMEYMSGGDLSDWIKERGALSTARALDIALDLADALTRAHRLDIIHRDIKPSNILIAEDSTPRLTDFGVASLGKSDRVTETGAMVGTLDYIAPEILNGAEADPRTDIWAFGVVLFEMLVGTRPFKADSVGAMMMAIMKQDTPDLEVLRPDLPIALIDLVYRMLAKDPHARIPSVRLVGAEIEAILQGTGSQKIRRTGLFDAIENEPDTVVFEQARFATPTPASNEVKNNLPANLTPFVGRENELDEVMKLITNAKTRLVTILAHGGMGKTRLSLEVGTRLLKAFADGVFFVPLAPLNSAENIIPTIADAVGYKFYTGKPERLQLLDYLREKEVMLIMDNFEHVLDGAEVVSTLLRNAPKVKIIVTSRESLNLQEENRFRITGMEFPDWETPADALEYSAVKLFVQSAQRALSTFELVADDLTYVARICRLVQGMPLGIVLGAAWVEMLSLPEIADEIARSLDFLETDSRNVPDRHRSIRAVFETSWQNLSDEEKMVFAKMSVFRGGFSRKAGQTITGASLRTMTALVNKSLIIRNPDTGHYDVHELLRQYAELEMRAMGLEAETRQAHCDYYCDALAQRDRELKGGPRQLAALNEIEGDIENVRLAWDWAIENRLFGYLNKSAFSIQIFYNQRNRFKEHAETFKKILVFENEPLDCEDRVTVNYIKGFYVNATPDHEERVRLLQSCLDAIADCDSDLVDAMFYQFMANAETNLTHFDRAEALLLKAIELNDKHNNIWAQGWNNAMLGWLYGMHYGDTERGIQRAERALQIFEQVENGFGIAFAYNVLGVHYQRLGDVAKNKSYNYKAYEKFRELGGKPGMSGALNNIAWRAVWAGELDEAREKLLESYQILKDLGIPAIAPVNNLGFVELLAGNLPQAKAYFLEVLDMLGLEGFLHNPLYPELISGIAMVYAREGNKERAVELLASALPHPGMPAAMDVADKARELFDELASQLPAKTFQAAQKRGETIDKTKFYHALLQELH